MQLTLHSFIPGERIPQENVGKAPENNKLSIPVEHETLSVIKQYNTGKTTWLYIQSDERQENLRTEILLDSVLRLNDLLAIKRECLGFISQTKFFQKLLHIGEATGKWYWHIHRKNQQYEPLSIN